MSETAPDPDKAIDRGQRPDAQLPSAPQNLDRSRRMQSLPSNIRGLEDEYFFQSYLRKKRFDL